MAGKVKWISAGIGMVLFLLILINLELVIYGVVQGYGQARIILNAKPIDEIYQDPNSPDSLLKKLYFIDSVRNFSVQKLGLIDSENYKSLYDQKGKPLMFVVSACKPFSFVPKTWAFPWVGEVPYKGYFRLDLARREYEQLERAGWDAGIRVAEAWSTLGWFKDPILSNMLDRNKGDLANLIIHELSHGTIFVKNDVEFNENLATLIGDVGAEKCLKEFYGEKSKEMLTYLHEQNDSKKYGEHIFRTIDKLDSLYKTLEEDTPDSVKESLKKIIIEGMVTQIDTLRLMNGGDLKGIFEEKLPNNSYFMSFVRYRSNQDSLKNVLYNKYNGNIKEFVLSHKEKR